jgi:autotransporter translocation and assembly factor TamB
VHFDRGRVAFGSSPPLEIGFDARVRLGRSALEVETARIETAGCNLAAAGTLTLAADPQGQFTLRGPVALEELDTHIWRTGLGIRGDGVYDGTLEVDGPRLRFRGRLEGTDGLFDGVPIPAFSGLLAWNESGLSLRDLKLQVLGGAGTVDFDSPAAALPARLQATYEAVDAEGAFRAIFDLGPMSVGSAATGTAQLSWPKGRFRELSGGTTFDLTPKSDGRTPVQGRVQWSATQGDQRLDHADLRSPSTAVRLRGTIDRQRRLDLAVDADSSDLAGSDDIGLRLRQSLGNPEALELGFSGRGTFRGRCRGTLDIPVYEGRFSGRDVGYLGVVWGQAEWAGSASPEEVRSHSLFVHRASGELTLDGNMETGSYGDRDGLDVKVQLRGWPVEDLVRAFHWDTDVSGPVTGQASVHGRRSAPQGSVRATVGPGRYYGLAFEALEAESALRGRVTEVPKARARLGGGEVLIRGVFTDDETYDGRAIVRNVDLAGLIQGPPEWASWAGQLSGDLTLQGTFARPRLHGTLSSPGLRWGDIDLGGTQIVLHANGEPSLAVGVTCGPRRDTLVATGQIGTLAPHLSQIEASLDNAALAPLLRQFVPELSDAVALATTARLTLRGPLSEPRQLIGEATIADLQLLLPDYPIRNRGPVQLSLHEGRLALEDATLTAEGTNLSLRGSADVLAGPEGPVTFELKGEADLRGLSAVTERVRGRGTARLQVAVEGTRGAPRVEGLLELIGGGLRLRGLPQGLEDVGGKLRFTENGARLESLSSTLGGGQVEAEGDAAFSAGRLSSFDVRATARGVALRYPEGLRSSIDGDLRLSGDTQQQWLSGDVFVRQALWTRRYDITSELLSGAATATDRMSGEEAGLRCDLRLHIPGTLRVDNNLAALDARAELNLVGTLDSPVILGRADIDRGRLFFRGNTYVVRRGTIDFADPRRTDPFFDIEAETSMRGYRVVLSVAGTLARVHPRLTSDPPLSPLQILNLLAGADESSVTGLTQAKAQRDQAYLAATGAASLAAGRLSEEVGLEREAQRLFGLSRFSIDPRTVNPAYAEGGFATTARLSVAKRITPDVSVLYAQDLGGKEEYLLSLEFTLSDRVSLLLTRSERPGAVGEYGFDIFLRHVK